MPAALTSTSFKLGAFTAVSSAFGAGLAAIALTYTAPADPFGGAPVFEIEMFRDAGMSAPSAAKSPSSASKPTPQTTKTADAPQSEAKSVTAETAPSAHVAASQAATNITRENIGPSEGSRSTANSSETSRHAAPPRASAPSASGDDRRGAPTQGAQAATQVDDYEAQVIRWLDQHKTHPGRLEGVVTLKFEVDRRGRLLDCNIVKSSGDGRLDRIAQQQLKDAAPLPRPARNTTWQTREITVSMDYRRHT